MSEQVLVTGTIKKVDLGFGAPESYMMKILKEKSLWDGYIKDKEKYPSLDHSIKDYFLDMMYKEYEMINGELYQVVDYNESGAEDIFKATDNGDGTYDFTLSYYNGGCCFSEAIEEAMKGVK